MRSRYDSSADDILHCRFLFPPIIGLWLPLFVSSLAMNGGRGCFRPCFLPALFELFVLLSKSLFQAAEFPKNSFPPFRPRTLLSAYRLSADPIVCAQYPTFPSPFLFSIDGIFLLYDCGPSVPCLLNYPFTRCGITNFLARTFLSFPPPPPSN